MYIEHIYIYYHCEQYPLSPFETERVFINEVNFRPISTGIHNSTGHLLPCAIDFKTNHPPVY